MQTPHPLDRPVWSAFTTRQASLALGDPRTAIRLAPQYGVFAATADESPASLAALAGLVPAEGALAVVEIQPMRLPPGTVAVSHALCHQMVAPALTPDLSPSRSEICDLTDDDAPEMLALATLTKPGPFFERTHDLGRFVGIKQDGRLVAMAGERMQPEGFTEVSGVCTHPDHRGHGYAGALMRVVAGRILAQGETPFLHTYADNVGAIALYRALGFALRTEIAITLLARAPAI
jgi:predicted GNAT family acetyltransferase